MQSVEYLGSLINQNLDAYRAGSIPLHALVGELDAILVEIENQDPAFASPLRNPWGVLEQINALHLDVEEQTSESQPTSDQSRAVYEAIVEMKRVLSNAENAEANPEAFAAMFYFLEAHYQRTGSDDIAALLGGLTRQPDGGPADPAVTEDWQAAVNAARNEEVQTNLRLNQPGRAAKTGT